MTVKERTLNALLAQRGEYLSGGELSRRLSVSRNAVWKAVRSLQEDGYDIDAVTGKGYRLGAGDVLSEQGIACYLKTDGLRLQVYPCVTSTNRLVKELGEQGEPEGAVVVAGEQTEGRGRRGRRFCSPPDTGLYMSVLLRPCVDASGSLLITTAAAVAVARAIERLSAQTAQIKWVNDVYCRNKKVCGILTEASLDAESGGLDYAVLGIGINVQPPKDGFPPDVAAVAGAVFDTAHTDGRCQMAAAVLDEFFAEYTRLEQRGFVAEYRARSLLPGRHITVKLASGDRGATALAVDDECRLSVRFDDGEERTLSSGEVSIAL